MQGKIIKGIAGFYYVHVAGSGIYECKAKGIFRKENKKPLVGDNVEIDVLDEKDMEGSLVRILPRKNELIRPAVANVDQALVVFAAAKPDPHLNLLDRYAPYVPADSLYTDVVDEILKTAVADGKGLELNTSSWRYGMGDRTTPTAAILRRYRELGGEFITVGSDAHSAKWVGDHLNEGYQFLRDQGWDYCVVYRQRKPCFVKL